MEARIKSWGREEIFESNRNYEFRKLSIFSKQTLLLSDDIKKHRTLMCISGIAKILYEIDGQESQRYLKIGDMMTIKAMSGKSISALDCEAVLIETSCKSLDKDNLSKWFWN